MGMIEIIAITILIYTLLCLGLVVFIVVICYACKRRIKNGEAVFKAKDGKEYHRECADLCLKK